MFSDFGFYLAAPGQWPNNNQKVEDRMTIENWEYFEWSNPTDCGI